MNTAFPERTSKDEIELGSTLRPKFDADGLIPCITQDAHSGEILMFAFMNQSSLRHTLETGNAAYWSRSRGKLWIKGEESGNTLKVAEIRVDCDQDVILLKVAPTGAACHQGFRSCFYRKIADPARLTLEHVGGDRLFDPAKVYRK